MALRGIFSLSMPQTIASRDVSACLGCSYKACLKCRGAHGLILHSIWGPYVQLVFLWLEWWYVSWNGGCCVLPDSKRSPPQVFKLFKIFIFLCTFTVFTCCGKMLKHTQIELLSVPTSEILKVVDQKHGGLRQLVV